MGAQGHDIVFLILKELGVVSLGWLDRSW